MTVLPTPVQHLIAGGTATFSPSAATTLNNFSVLSYNILLPNSVDGWWNYKMYDPSILKDNPSISEWKYRQSLLMERLERVDADIICLQEVCPESFEEDFDFLRALGYTKCEMFRKGRFRPATFWKPARVELQMEPVHKDRTLLTAFRLTEQEQDNDEETSTNVFYILNCHLQAGPQGPRRLRQINEGVRAVGTLHRKIENEWQKMKKNAPKRGNKVPSAPPPLVVCGDFNGGEECAAVRYLEDGKVDSTFHEDGAPVTSSEKVCPLGALKDVTVTVERTNIDPNNAMLCRTSPPTMVVRELISLMVDGVTTNASVEDVAAAYDNPSLSRDVKERLTRIFHSFASESPDGQGAVMNHRAVEAWLTRINGKVGRGSEFRSAARKMGWVEKDQDSLEEENPENNRVELPYDGSLSLSDFIDIYEEELKGGKFWGIAYDLYILGQPLPDGGLYKARYDRMYFTSSLQPCAVMDFLSQKACPNEDEPSDHLPVAASFNLIELN